MMMSNLSAESFPDDSIIHNISLHPPLLPAVVISGEASSSDSGPAAAQLPQSSAPIIARPPLSMRSALLQKTASIPPSDFELELLNNVATLSIFDSLSSKARSLSPESLCDRSTSTTTSTASTSDRSTSGTSTTSSSSTKFTKSATATASSSSNASGGSSSGVSTSTGGVSRRLGAAFKQHGAGSNGSGSAPMLLSKKSASVDSLHHPGAAADKSLQPRRSQRYDHVRSKVKEYIDTQREEDQRRRMATKFQRHRSMPESLYDPLAEAAATTTSATAAAQPDAAALGELRSTLRHKDAQLAEMEQTIRSLHLCYEVSMRDHDDKVRLERKVEVMRLELLQANNERRHYQDELQLLLLKKQQAASSSASSSSASAASSTASTTGSYRLPGPISLMNARTNAGSVSYGESSVGSASSSSASAAEFAVVESAMSTGNGGKTGGGGGVSGLHLRPSAAAAAAAAADKASPGGRRGANMSAGSAHSMRQIIGHSGTSDYRLLGDHDHDDDRAAADAQSDDDDDDGDIALFDQSAVRGGAIISSSSMSSHEDRLSDAANAGFAMSPGCAGGGGPRRKIRGGRRRRIGRAIRKRLRRMLGRCGACLDAAGKEDSGSDRYDSMADISLLYTGLNSGGGGPEGGDESTATATTGYNSFS